MLDLQRSAGNAAVVQAAAPTTASRAFSAPHEPPLLAPRTVRSAEQLKRDVDLLRPDLLIAMQALAQTAPTVIEGARSSHAAASSILDRSLEPYLPSAGSLLGEMVAVTLDLTTFAIPGGAMVKITRAMVNAALSSWADSAATASKDADRASQKTQWLQDTHVVGESLYWAAQVIPDQHHALLSILLAVDVPWADVLRAQDANDERATMIAAASFVPAARMFVAEAPRMTDALRDLRFSYLLAALDNTVGSEYARLLALVSPAVLSRRIPGAFGYQSDRRPDFVSRVLVPRIDGLAIDETAQGLGHPVTVRQLAGDYYRLEGRRPAPVSTVHLHGREVEFQGRWATLAKVQEIAEAHRGMSLRSVTSLVDSPARSWIDDTMLGVTLWRPPHQHELMAMAGPALARALADARQHWNRLAGVVS